jgi:hypothetical protein
MAIFRKKRASQFASIVGSFGIAALALATVAGASAAPLRATASPAAPTFVLHGRAVGGITLIQTGQTLTFVFRETNKGPGSAPEDLALIKVRHATVSAITCVLPNGHAINPDGTFCEPGRLSRGQSASSVITTSVTGSSGAVVSARLCLDNEHTGVQGPCKKVSVKIA